MSSALDQQTILGCPVPTILSLESACAFTAVPTCVTATAALDSACCNSLTSYGLSVASCFSAHAPACLDTSAIAASLTGASGSNPCAAYATAVAGASSTASMALTSASALSSSAAAAASTASSNAAASTGASGTGSSASPSATGKSAAPKVTVGLKAYLGVALVGALAVLAM